MENQHAPAAQALGIGGAHKILAEDFQHRSAHQAADDGRAVEAERDGWQHQVGQRGEQRLRPAGQCGGGRLQQRRLAADRRKPLQLNREPQHHQDAEPKHRHRYADLRDEHAADIQARAAICSGDDAEQEAEDDGHQQRGQGEFEGRAKPAGDQRRHRLVLKQRAAQVALQQQANVCAQPPPPGLIEPQIAAGLGDG